MALKALYALLGLGAFLGLVLLISPPRPVYTERTITIAGVEVVAEVADTPALQERGLSGRDALLEGKGMLFVFPEDGVWAFWMKDMRFSIDIVWADASGTVVHIEQNVAPETYPQSFAPEKPARYVLELPAGFAQTHGLAEGAYIVL